MGLHAVHDCESSTPHTRVLGKHVLGEVMTAERTPSRAFCEEDAQQLRGTILSVETSLKMEA